jgi:hypothetical protein
MTPNFAVVEVRSPYCQTPRLWLPLFLLWIPVIVLSPVILLILLVLAVACLAGGINPWNAIATFWAILCSLRGTHVHVSTHESKVTVRIL